MPLDDITSENGQTEFLEGSHRLTYERAKDVKHVKNELKAGSVVLFYGRIFHRACAHPSNKPRRLIYLVFHRNWYFKGAPINNVFQVSAVLSIDY